MDKESSLKKKVLFLSSGDTFGAYEFIFRMAKFMEFDYEVAMVVRDRRKVEPWLFQLPIVFHKKRFIKRLFNFVKRKIGFKTEYLETDPKYVFLPHEDERVQLVKANSILHRIPFNPDLIISGMTDGFLNTTTLLELKKITSAQVYQVMVDMSFITGGCHYFRECKRFKIDCSLCPAIQNKKYKNFPAINFSIKKKNIKQGNFKLMAVPGWTIHEANLSALYKNSVKPIACSVIDTDIFTNTKRTIAKQLFDIPENSIVLFAGSNNVKSEIKGRKYFADSLSILWKQLDISYRNRIVVLMIGNHNNEDDITKTILFKKKLLPFISDYKLLSLAYQASTVFVSPSLEDAGPMMVAEALACGTPVVGFETGFLYDNTLVQNGLNGYRVKIKNSLELANAIQKVINLNKVDFQKISNYSRDQALKHVSKEAFLSSIENI